MSQEKHAQCCIGIHSNTDCHKTSYVRSSGITDLNDLNQLEIELVRLRSELSREINTICFHHQKLLLDKYETYQRTCCNPFKDHVTLKKGCLRSINMKLVKAVNNIPLKLVPGKKICPACNTKIKKLLEETADEQVMEFEHDDGEISVLQQSAASDMDRSQLGECFSAIGISPIKVHSLPKSRKLTKGKRKLETVVEVLKGKVAKALNLPAEKLDVTNRFDSKEVEEKARAFDTMMSLLKQKVRSLKTSNSRIQVLTLSPSNWAIKETANFFDVSEYIIRQARKLAAEKGILSLPSEKRGKSLPESSLKIIDAFYQDDEISRLMPGRKDFVSISKNVHMQKRLILCNLKELFVAFKERFPLVKVGFSKFCSLRPKWCVLVGSSGTHSVCVCVKHQNMKLLLSPIDQDYKYLIDKFIVCSSENKDCMIRRCPYCPKAFDELIEHLNTAISVNFEDSESVDFTQWTSIDRATLIMRQESKSDYIDLVIEQLNELTAHSYIAKAQSRHLRKRKEEITENTALFLGDFAENFQFVVQDEVQSFHWNNKQASLHPVVLYYRKDSTLEHLSYCVLSDDMNHDVNFVYKVQATIIEDVRSKLPNLTNLEYFSDGCAGQYKNRKNFLNLCNHEKDFSIKATWSFFATSHGKQPCDGIGGTVKRLVARESLTRTVKDQILDVQAMYEFCKKNIKEINFILISKTDIDKIRITLEKRFEGSVAVSGTRSFHHYVPLSESVVAVKRCSEDAEYSIKHDLLGRNNTPVEVTITDYVACIYENKWWVGVVVEIDKEDQDVFVKFMHPSGPAKSFHWPTNDDTCWVPMAHVLMRVDIPNTTTGRQYSIEGRNITNIHQKFLELTN